MRTHVGIINGDSRLMNVSHNFSFLVLHLKVFKKMTRLTDLKGNKNSKKTTGKRIYCSFCRDCTIQVKRLKVKRGHKSLPKKRLKSLTLVYIYGQKSARRCHHHHPLQTIYQWPLLMLNISMCLVMKNNLKYSAKWLQTKKVPWKVMKPVSVPLLSNMYW